MGYGMKFLQEQYNVTASVAAICGGLVAFGGLIGAVLPIIGIKYLKWRGSTCLAVCSISSVMDFLKTNCVEFRLSADKTDFLEITLKSSEIFRKITNCD
jgi:hypothetical protein